MTVWVLITEINGDRHISGCVSTESAARAWHDSSTGNHYVKRLVQRVEMDGAPENYGWEQV